MDNRVQTKQETRAFDSTQKALSPNTNRLAKRTSPGASTLNPNKLAKGLGWFSVGLGLTELFCPKVIARISGLPGKHTGVIRLYGLRELAAGGAIFLQDKPTEAVWSRVVGDVMDLASLGAGFGAPNAKRGKLAFAVANVLSVTALDLICAKQLSQTDNEEPVVKEQAQETRDDDRTSAQLLQQVRDDLFDSNNEKFALALGTSGDLIQKIITGDEIPNADLLMKARALREQRVTAQSQKAQSGDRA